MTSRFCRMISSLQTYRHSPNYAPPSWRESEAVKCLRTRQNSRFNTLVYPSWLCEGGGCCTTQRRFARTWRGICCGDGLGRWRPCRRCALSYKRACSRWVRPLLVIAEFAGNCMIAEKAQHIQLRALVVLRDGALKHQFVLRVHEEWLRREPRSLLLRSANKAFIVVR